MFARDYLYFNQRYKMNLPQQGLKKCQAGDKQYLPGEWKVERNNRILK